MTVKLTNGKISTLIVDDNKDFAQILSNYLSIEKDFEVVGIASDGLEALELIKTRAPNLIVLDLIMPHLDGLGVLEELQELVLPSMPSVIVLSAIGHDEITKKALGLGANYYLMKPFDMKVFINRLREMFKIAPRRINNDKPNIDIDENKNIELEIFTMLHDLGIPVHVKGYLYIKEAITMVINNVSLLSAVTKELYPAIAKKFITTDTRVERTIRHAIELAWERQTTEAHKNLFQEIYRSNKTKPTNSEFIAVIADLIRLKLRNNE